MLKTNAQRATVIGIALLLVLAGVAAAVSYRQGDDPDPSAPWPATGGSPPSSTLPLSPEEVAAPTGRGNGPTGHGDDSGAPGAMTAAPPGGETDTLDPDAYITWDHLYGMLRAALDPAVAPRVHQESLANFLEPGTDPTSPVTRGGLAMTIVRALGLEDIAAAQQPAESLFQDVSPLHRAFAAVAMAHHLGLLPHQPGDMLRPEQVVTVEEVQAVLDAARLLEIRSGQLEQVNEPASSLSILGSDGWPAAYVVASDTVIVRNAETVGAAQLLRGDAVRTVADSTGRLRVLVAEGPQVSAAQQALIVLGPILQEMLTPEQTAAILARDWERAGTELKTNLYNQLLAHGLTAEEAAAVLDQDWAALTEHGKARVTELAAARWSVEPELVRAILDQNWDVARTHVEVVILEYLLNELLETTNA